MSLNLRVGSRLKLFSILVTGLILTGCSGSSEISQNEVASKETAASVPESAAPTTLSSPEKSAPTASRDESRVETSLPLLSKLPVSSAQDARQAIHIQEFIEHPDVQIIDSSASNAMFETPLSLDATVKLYTAKLSKRGWTPLADPQSASEQYIRMGFSKGDYYLRFDAIVSGTDTKKPVTNVTLANCGNIDLRRLPRLGDASLLPGGDPSTANYQAHGEVSELAKNCRQLLIGNGWHEYTDIEGSSLEVPHVKTLQFLHDAVRLQVVVAQLTDAKGKEMPTTIGYFVVGLLPEDLPLPDQLQSLRISNTLNSLDFETRQNSDLVAKFYRDRSKSFGWTEMIDSKQSPPQRNTIEFQTGKTTRLQIVVANSMTEGVSKVSLKLGKTHPTAKE